MKFREPILPLVFLLLTTVGCKSTQQEVYECCDDVKLNIRNRWYADQAWSACGGVYEDVECPGDFAKGFKDGYVAFASSGARCVPALPPECYWGFHYQNPEGQCHMLAWFNGYSHGVVAAESDGVGDWGRIMTAPTLPPYRKMRPRKAPPTPLEEVLPPEGGTVSPLPPMAGVNAHFELAPDREEIADPNSESEIPTESRPTVDRR